jgi:hypothetical protein
MLQCRVSLDYLSTMGFPDSSDRWIVGGMWSFINLETPLSAVFWVLAFSLHFFPTLYFFCFGIMCDPRIRTRDLWNHDGSSLAFTLPLLAPLCHDFGMRLKSGLSDGALCLHKYTNRGSRKQELFKDHAPNETMRSYVL